MCRTPAADQVPMTCGEVSQQVPTQQVGHGAPASDVVRRKFSPVHFNPMPQTEVEVERALPFDEGTERLRNFESTKRGRIVNRGDSFRRERKLSSLARQRAVLQESRPDDRGVLQRSVTMPSMPDPLREAAGETRRVVLLGSPGVGKASLCRQFQTSEYTNGCEQTIDYEDAAPIITVRLDDTETRLAVGKRTTSVLDMPDEAAVRSHDALVVVYSVIDAASFATARGLCHVISSLAVRRPVILVANKCDLVRLRKVTAKDGRSLAVQFDYKYIETSVVINSNVDELLAGIAAQIRFYHQFESLDSAEEVASVLRLQQRRAKRIKSRTLPSTVVKELLQRVIGHKESKSCDNLLTV